MANKQALWCVASTRCHFCMVEITTDEFALTENARALSGNPVGSVHAG